MAVTGSFDRLVAMTDRAALSRQDVDHFLFDFGRHIGLDKLALDEDGTSLITIDGDIELSLAHFPHLPGIVVGTPIANVPTDRPEYLKTVMQANMSIDLTRGGVFTMLPGKDEVMICWFVSLVDLDIARIDREFAEIVEFARFWVAEIAAAIDNEQSVKAIEQDLPTHAIKV